MGNLDKALASQDRASFFPAADYCWTAEQLHRAKDRYYNQIMDGLAWDENLEGYRADMLCDIERILCNKNMSRDEKIAEISDIHHKAVMNHVDDAVWLNPSKYCVEGF